VDAYPQPAKSKEIKLRFAKTDVLLGITIASGEQVRLLKALGLEAVAESETTATFRIPTWRVDLKRETDLIEEIERLYGVEKVPATPPRGALGANAFDTIHDQIAEARRILAGMGLNEAQGQTLISDAAAKLVVPTESLAMLANPLSSDMNALRPSLLPGLIDSLRHNVSHKNYDVALFEVGRVFQRAAGVPPTEPTKKQPGPQEARGTLKEERRVAIALTGQRQPTFWSGTERDAKFDLSDLKGFIEELLEQFGVRGVSYARRADSTAFFLESASVQLGRNAFGEVGQLSPALAKQYDLRDAVLVAELGLDLLIARRASGKSFKALPAFPAVRRDVAMLVAEATAHEAVLQVVKQAKPANLEAVELFDVFRGKNVPTGQKSLAYAFTYRSPERTLTDAEVNAAHEQVVAALKQKLQAVVREA